MLLERAVTYVPVWLLKWIYPIKETDRVRDREMKVLCLGLGRTGTDSLQNALQDMGYKDVYHGFRIISDGVGDTPQWERLSRAKMGPNPNPDFLTREQFDKVLGNCMAVSDQPCINFGVELLRLYPEAKVVLNRRSDVDAWHRSMSNTIAILYADWPSWSRAWFDGETFFIFRCTHWLHEKTGWDFARNGRQYYRDHYAELEAELRRQDRDWLDWTVQDGWEPLCQLLGEPVPDKPFPQGNAMGGQFEETRMRIHHDRIIRGFRNMKIAGGLTAVFTAAAIWWTLTN